MYMRWRRSLCLAEVENHVDSPYVIAKPRRFALRDRHLPSLLLRYVSDTYEININNRMIAAAFAVGWKAEWFKTKNFRVARTDSKDDPCRFQSSDR